MTEFKPGDWLTHPIDPMNKYYYVGNQPDGKPVLWYWSSAGYGERLAAISVRSLGDYSKASVGVKPGQLWDIGEGWVFKVLEVHEGTAYGRSHDGDGHWASDSIDAKGLANVWTLKEGTA